MAYLLFPKIYGWALKRLLAKNIRFGEFKNLLGMEHTISFNDENLTVNSSIAEQKFSLNSIEYIAETTQHFFIKIKSPSILCFPKNQLPDPSSLRDYLNSIVYRFNLLMTSIGNRLMSCEY